MVEELEALTKNNTWSLVDRPAHTNIIRSKWTYKLKRDALGAINRYKARLVAVGTSQIYGLDYDETFSPVIKWESVRLVLWYAINNHLPCTQLDVSNAYLSFLTRLQNLS
jgi:hypothetical protein